MSTSKSFITYLESEILGTNLFKEGSGRFPGFAIEVYECPKMFT